jgi:integrase
MPKCPECSSERLYQAGLRYLSTGETVQRWLCRDCGYRFSQPNEQIDVASQLRGFNSRSQLTKPSVSDRDFSIKKSLNDVSFPLGEDVCSHNVTVIGKGLNALCSNSSKRRICAQKDAKNLAAQEEIEKACAGDGKLLNYAWLLKKKRGAADNTINLRVSTLKLIQKKGVNLNDPESFETVLATEPLTKARKWQWVACYKSYARIMKIPWEPIRVKYEPKEPFLPTHEEMNALINAASKRLATFLQVAKTTGGRVGELCKIRWIDIDTEKNTISINNAEKGSRNRTIKVPQKTIVMINSLRKRHPIHVFNTKPCNVRVIFQNLRKRLAYTQNNPRFLQIHLHTFRHFYATETLRRTNSLRYVKYTLGHKSIMNTERYTHLIDFGSDKYHSAIATTIEEVRKLAEDGWTYFQEIDGIKVFRKPQ